jgi:hypothetical protein
MFQFLEMGVILVILVMLVSMVQYDSLSLIFSCFGVACFRIFIPFPLKPLPYPVLTGNRVLYSAGAEFQNILNLSAGDLVSTELRLDKKACPRIILHVISHWIFHSNRDRIRRKE